MQMRKEKEAAPMGSKIGRRHRALSLAKGMVDAEVIQKTDTIGSCAARCD